MKLKYFLKKYMGAKTGYLLTIVLVAVLILGGYFSYALFTASSESKGALNIVTGNLYASIESSGLDSDKEVVLTPNETRVIPISLVNVNKKEAKLNLYYSTTSNDIEIGYLASGDQAPGVEGVILGEQGSSTERKNIKVRITNRDSGNVTISFGANAGLSTATLDFPAEKGVLNALTNNIIDAYQYNQDASAPNLCITGEEETCIKTNCYQTSAATTCPNGTIIKYMVNDDTLKYFYVIHDDGATMTLQENKNTVNNISWNINETTNTYDNTVGPVTVLQKLEEKTSDWANVENQTYLMGTTPFLGNSFTGCATDFTCNVSSYTMASRTAKARLITGSELGALGCGLDPSTCPMYLYQNLDLTAIEGGTSNLGYWTMMASSTDQINAWAMTSAARVQANYTNSTDYGARAVVVVQKER